MKQNVVLCHQLTTLDRAKILQKIGELSAVTLAQVEAAIVAALDLP
jgi:mRNA-degrading endonuclease toxin of MazEF toxin-antitoxin module